MNDYINEMVERAKKTAREGNVIFNEDNITKDWLEKTGWVYDEDNMLTHSKFEYRLDLFWDEDADTMYVLIDESFGVDIPIKTKGQLIAFVFAVTGELIDQPKTSSWDRYKK